MTDPWSWWLSSLTGVAVGYGLRCVTVAYRRERADLRSLERHQQQRERAR